MNTQRAAWLRVASIILAYTLTIAGLLFLIPWLFSLSKSWLVGLLLFIVVVPLFPATQTILMGHRQASVTMFLKIYVSEYASLLAQMVFLLASAPFIAIAVAGRLAIVLLATALMAWIIVGLQQMGLQIGSQLAREDIKILFWVTLGLAASVAIYYGLHHLAKKYEERYFDIWAAQFKRIKEFLRY